MPYKIDPVRSNQPPSPTLLCIVLTLASASATTQATGMIDYDEVAKLAAAFKPRILVTGFSAYCRDLDYKRCGPWSYRVA